jgi:2-desacetyl-2-hydroxyethyl bacteriochlorophyllide A dehydrogenase
MKTVQLKGGIVMKAAVLYGKKDLRIEDVKVPSLRSDEVLIAPRAVGVCGTDYHIFTGQWKVDYPRIMGHEFTGEVVETGPDVKTFKTGDRVLVEPDIMCGRCYYCTTLGVNNYLCENHPAIGDNRDGAFAEFVKVPEKILYPLPDAIDFERGALIEPMACAMHGTDQSEIKPGDNVIILGAGAMGLLLMRFARLRGAARIVISEPNIARRKNAAELGADIVLDPASDDIKAESIKAFNGRAADVVLEAVGKKESTEQAFTLSRPGGRICIVGVIPQGTPVTIHDSFNTFFIKELTIVGSNGAPKATFERSIRLLAAKKLDVEPLITHRFRLHELERAFSIIRDGKELSVKMIVNP